MVFSTKDHFEAASRSKTKTVRIELLGEDVMIRSLYGYEQERLADVRNRLGESPTLEDLYRNLIAPTVAYGLVDEEGKRIFGDNGDDLEVILRLQPQVISEIATKVAQFCGLTAAGVDEAKNASSSDQSEGSISA